MISRVAESCFWMLRYMERIENTARMLEVNRSAFPDVSLSEFARWRPLIIVSGEEERFLEAQGPKAIEDGELVQNYLTWDEKCPVAILTSLRWARENARTIREAISQEMWESINDLWLWIRKKSSRRFYNRNRFGFYERIKDSCLHFHGVCHNTMHHEEPFDFMRLGMLLERAGQTGRMLDVHHHTLAPRPGAAESAVGTAQWIAILQSCSARDAFFKKSRKPISGTAVAEFLLLERHFPRAIHHCLSRAWNFLERVRVRGNAEVGESSALLLGGLIERLRSRTISEVLEIGIHEELTWIIDHTMDACRAIHADYFDPSVPSSTA